MLRTIVFDGNAQTIKTERIYRSIEEWDLPGEMKVWFEYPESTKFARYPYDITYTPIFFANEGVSAHLCIEANETISGEILELNAEVALSGTVSLGVLNLGHPAAHVYDSRHAFSNIGFRSIVTVPVMDVYDTLSLDAGPYERSGIVGRRVPFQFPIPTQTLAELREVNPSLKLISSDTQCTLEVLKDRCPTMLLNVRYCLTAILYKGQEEKQKIEQDVRIFVALDEQQIPPPLPDISQLVTQHRRSSTVSLKGSRTLALRPSRRKSFYEGGNHIIIEADKPDPFCFQTHSDAAATKVRLTLTYGTNDPAAEAPGPVQGNVEWLMKSLSTIAVQANTATEEAPTPPSDDYFHLRTRHMPLRKLKMNWNAWTRPRPDENAGHAWRSTQELWLTEPTTSGLTPTFRSSFLSHSYTLWLLISLSGKGMKSRSYKVELNIPVEVHYDVGQVPSYVFDSSLPQYSVDEGAFVQQAGPPPEHPVPDDRGETPPPEPPPPDRRVMRYSPDELAELVRSTEGIDLNEADQLSPLDPSATRARNDADQPPPFDRRATIT